MELSIEQKELILAWMKTKPYFQEMINRLGQEGTISDYLKDKSPKRLQYILRALKTKYLKKQGNLNSELAKH